MLQLGAPSGSPKPPPKGGGAGAQGGLGAARGIGAGRLRSEAKLPQNPSARGVTTAGATSRVRGATGTVRGAGNKHGNATTASRAEQRAGAAHGGSARSPAASASSPLCPKSGCTHREMNSAPEQRGDSAKLKLRKSRGGSSRGRGEGKLCSGARSIRRSVRSRSGEGGKWNYSPANSALEVLLSPSTARTHLKNHRSAGKSTPPCVEGWPRSARSSGSCGHASSAPSVGCCAGVAVAACGCQRRAKGHTSS